MKRSSASGPHPGRALTPARTAPRFARLRTATVALAIGAALVGAAACGTAPAVDVEAIAKDLTRYRVDLAPDDHALGGAAPLVTIVVFSDYACGPCGRNWHVMRHLVEHYGDDVRVVYRSFTVPGHEHGDRAADAAFAAGAQGKFWEMHWRLFEDRDGFSRPSLRAHAEALGLDVPRFFDDLDGGAFTSTRLRHRRQARQLGINALPVTFVNGLYVLGPKEEEGWRALVDAEIAVARKRLADGLPRANMYATFMEGAETRSVSETAADKERRKRLQEEGLAPRPGSIRKPDGQVRYAIAQAPDGTAIGDPQAPIHIIAFIDFACLYCRKLHLETLSALRAERGEDLYIEVRHLPLEIHPTAVGAARAALAAGKQGRFADYHDALLASESPLTRERLIAIASELGLDAARFDADLEDPALAKQVVSDVRLANMLGVTGTPAMFVNGRFVDGYQTLAHMIAVLDEERAKVETELAAGTPRERVHAELMKEAVGPDGYPNAPGARGAGEAEGGTPPSPAPAAAVSSGDAPAAPREREAATP